MKGLISAHHIITINCFHSSIPVIGHGSVFLVKPVIFLFFIYWF